MRFQIFCATVLLSFLFLFPVSAQEQIQTSDSTENTQTKIFDRFPAVSDCDMRGRLDNFLVGLRDNPSVTGYIIFYRGADELPAQQTDAFATKILNLYSNHIRLRRFPNAKERIILIDGGFRSSSMTELWFMPPGGETPQPSETIEKTETPKNEAYLLESNYLELAGAEIPKPEEVIEETETEVQEETIENQDLAAQTEIAANQIEEELQSQEEIFEWTSSYFADALRENKSARGRVIFYTDETEYDLKKVREIIDKGLQDLAKKEDIDLSRVKIVFGGYRQDSQIEFWLVPRGAKKPKPKPQEKKITEEMNEVRTEN